jgi:hypothetical protein
MQRSSSSLIAGSILIGLGVLALFITLSGIDLWTASWRWWPTVIITFGALIAVLPIFIRKRWMGLLYIVAAPIVVSGIMLLISMTSGQWFWWARWWPIGVLSVALGFVLAAIYAREVWLMVPAIFIGVNGGLFLFNMWYGQWYLWKVLWIAQPLSLGLALLLVGVVKHSGVALGFGIALSVMSIFFSALMTPIFYDTARLTGSMGALTLVAIGAALLTWNVRRAPKTTALTSGTGNDTDNTTIVLPQ